MEETRFAGRYLRVTTEPRGDSLIERVYIRNGVSVIPVFPGNHVRLIREFDVVRNAVRMKLVSGWLEDDEIPLARARLELKQELGLTAEEMQLYHRATFEGGAILKTQYFFVARGLQKGPARPEAGEHFFGPIDFDPLTLRGHALSGFFGSSETAFVLLKLALELPT